MITDFKKQSYFIDLTEDKSNQEEVMKGVFTISTDITFNEEDLPKEIQFIYNTSFNDRENIKVIEVNFKITDEQKLFDKIKPPGVEKIFDLK
jgi:hypothetical protein